MSAVSASLVKELREQTGAGMMDCKRALEETGADIEAARRLLRERGMARAAKRAGRETTEGKVLARVGDSIGAIAAVGCETEPVASNTEFRGFAERVLDAVERDGLDAVSRLEDERVELVARLGENIVVRGASRMQAAEGETLAAYVHPPAHKVGVLVKVRRGSRESARRLAMHAAFGAPGWLRREDVPADVVDAERQIYLASDELRGKPEHARDRIVEGMLAKRLFAAQPGGVLLDQPWIHEPSQSVAQALASEGAEVVELVRYAVAE